MLNFIKSYLKDRKQRVVVGGNYSKIASVNSGVPQGSILGPLLFVLFTNDISEVITEGTNIALYADDTKIWRKICSCSDCVILNNDIESLSKWADRNMMKFHPNKCKVLSTSLKRVNYYILPFDRFSYELKDSVLDYCSTEKDLGVIITPKITWDSHQNSITSKALRQLGLLKRTCHFIKNQSQKRALYITLVRSLFEHCGEIWGPNAVVAQNQFEPKQKWAVKWILSESNRRYNEAEYMNKLKVLNLLPIQHYFQLKKLRLFYRILKDSIGIDMPDYVVQHRLATYASNNRHKLSVTTNINQPIVRPFGNSFFPSTIAIWNSLPNSIHVIDSVNEFTYKTKEYIWTNIIRTHNLEPD